MSNITLQEANVICRQVLETAREKALNPMSVAVLDSGGHLVAFQREDNSGNIRPEIAIGKAATALGLNTSSRNFAEIAADRPTFATSLMTASQGRFIASAGGLLIKDDQGNIRGAVGVTGDLPDQDEICAQSGIDALN